MFVVRGEDIVIHVVLESSHTLIAANHPIVQESSEFWQGKIHQELLFIALETNWCMTMQRH